MGNGGDWRNLEVYTQSYMTGMFFLFDWKNRKSQIDVVWASPKLGGKMKRLVVVLLYNLMLYLTKYLPKPERV